MLTLSDFDLCGKTVFLRADMNCPIDPVTGKILGTKRIEETAETICVLKDAKVVVASHQGRVGNRDYTGMRMHAQAMEKILGRNITYVQDVIGQCAQDAIKAMNNGDILLLDNLRLCAEENYEFSAEAASKTVMVKRLAGLFDLCVMDSFPTAHRAHPSLVGFPHVLPACAGLLVEREVNRLNEIMTVAKAPHVIVLGGAKVRDRLEAIRLLIANKRADHILLTGLIASVFLRAQGRIKHKLDIKNEKEIISIAHALIGDHPDVFSTPVDVAVMRGIGRLEIDVRDVIDEQTVCDIGKKTLDHYGRYISGAGTVFISGPAGMFEHEEFSVGTRGLLESVANSMATTIVSGGHLSSALKKYNLDDKVDHVSTAGGALVQYLTGKKLPMIQALDNAKKTR